MRNLFIFGDSFLAPYTPNELARFNWKREYVSAEDGDKVRNTVKDLNYWLKEYRERNSYRLINTAVSGTNNDYIFADKDFYDDSQENLREVSKINNVKVFDAKRLA